MDNLLEVVFKNIDYSNMEASTKAKYKQEAMTVSEKNCPILLTVHQVYELFEIDPTFLVKSNIRVYSKQKKDGRPRYIHQPSIKLKKIQKWILSEVLSKVTISTGAHAFVTKSSIYTNAEKHFRMGQDFWLYATDICDFFDSISQEKVKMIFVLLGYSEAVSELLSSFCCIDEFVVQGFSTSPCISNIIFKELDELFLTVSDKYNVIYTRYADDMFFSGLVENRDQLKKIKNIVEYSLEKAGFKINSNKNRIHELNDVKKITGLLVNRDAIKVPQKLKKFLAKEIYYCNKYGVDDHLCRTNQMHRSNYKGFLYGYAYFINMVEPIIGADFISKLDNIEF